MPVLHRVKGSWNPMGLYPIDYEASHITTHMNTIDSPQHRAEKTFVMFVEGINNGFATCSVSQDGFRRLY